MEIIHHFPLLSCLDSKFLKEVKTAYVFSWTGTEGVVETNDGKSYWLRIADSERKRDVASSRGSEVLLESIETYLKNGSGIRSVVTGLTSSCRGPSWFVCTSDGVIYAWGNNHFGELGVEGKDATTKIVQLPSPTPVVALQGRKAVKVACGIGFTLCMLEDGEVWAWGTQLPGAVRYPRKVTSSNLDKCRATDIACGADFALVQTKEGHVYGWGSSSCGQIGIGDNKQKEVSKPARIHFLHDAQIQAIACGPQHALALSDSGTLFTWGYNSEGQLGNGSTASSNVPWKVNFRNAGTVEVIGNALSSSSKAGDKTNAVVRIVEIAAHRTQNVSLALGHYNEVYIWGNCRGAQFVKPMRTTFKDLDSAFCAVVNSPMMLRPITLTIKEQNGTHAGRDDGQTFLASDLRGAFDDEESADLKIMVEEKPIHVHKSILTIRSKYFRTMFKSDWKESGGVLEIPDTSYEAYKAYLMYLYTGELEDELEPATALKVAVLAESHLDNRLAGRTAKIIRKGLTLENAIELLEDASRLSAKDVEVICLDFLAGDFGNAITAGLLEKLNEHQMREVLKKAAAIGMIR